MQDTHYLCLQLSLSLLTPHSQVDVSFPSMVTQNGSAKVYTSCTVEAKSRNTPITPSAATAVGDLVSAVLYTVSAEPSPN
jgi:hypothetical protein